MVKIIIFAVILMLVVFIKIQNFDNIDNVMAIVSANEVAPTSVSKAVLSAEGESVYRNQCTKCHGRNGEGQWYGHDAAPRLSGNLIRLSVKEIAAQVIQGGTYMPSFTNLSNREIAAVATYIRNSFGNNHGIATEEEIAENRKMYLLTNQKIK